MKASDIDTVARGLRDARPGSYPGGGPDTADGWRMFNAVVHEMGKALAGTCQRWSDHKERFEEIANNEKGG